MAIDPQFFTSLEGSTDSETMFLLAMSFGLEHTPVPAIARMAGFVEATARRHGIAHPLSMTVCASDGEQLVAVRYASEGQSPRSLYHSTSFKHLHALYPDDPRIAAVGDDAYLIVSEPLVDLPQAWAQVPESTAIVVRGTQIDTCRSRPFNLRACSAAQAQARASSSQSAIWPATAASAPWLYWPTMHIPQYWAQARLRHATGQRHGATVQRWGWSDHSQQEAENHAQQRAQQALDAVLAAPRNATSMRVRAHGMAW
jgi:hypothetical protein